MVVKNHWADNEFIDFFFNWKGKTVCLRNTEKMSNCIIKILLNKSSLPGAGAGGKYFGAGAGW